MDAPLPAGTTRPDWVLELANRWQVAAGLPLRTRRADLAHILADMLHVPSAPGSPLERQLLRGYYLEIELALRQRFHHCRNAEGLLRVQRLIDRLQRPSTQPADLEPHIQESLEWLRETPLRSQPGLAGRARAALDRWNGQRPSLQKLARRLHSNVRYVRRAFTREFGLSPARYLRQRRTSSILRALRADAASIKVIAHDSGCAEITVRRLVRRATGRSPRQVRAQRKCC